MFKLVILLPLVIISSVGCGTSDSSYENTSDYLSLQGVWDATPLDDKVNVCTNIQNDPSIVRSTATENGLDPDVSEQFFGDVCP